MFKNFKGKKSMAYKFTGRIKKLSAEIGKFSIEFYAENTIKMKIKRLV